MYFVMVPLVLWFSKPVAFRFIGKRLSLEEYILSHGTVRQKKNRCGSGNPTDALISTLKCNNMTPNALKMHIREVWFKHFENFNPTHFGFNYSRKPWNFRGAKSWRICLFSISGRHCCRNLMVNALELKFSRVLSSRLTVHSWKSRK
jgi:hypothetical protein